MVTYNKPMSQIKTITIFSLLLFGIFLIAPQADALWAYEQLFNTLNDGDLNGQDSWSGHAGFDVQTSVKYEGAKAVSMSTNISFSNVTRTITGISAGSVYFAMRRTSNSLGTRNTVQLAGSGTVLVYVGLYNTGKIRYYDGNIVSWVDFMDYSANQWYVFNIEFDDVNQPNKYRMRVHNGTSWSDWTSWTDVWNKTNYTVVDGISFEHQAATGAVTCYFDTITPTDPTVPADTCTCPSGDWYVNSSDNCYLSANCDLDTGKLFLLNTGEGAFNIIDSAELSVTGLESTSTDINVEAGGKINFK